MANYTSQTTTSSGDYNSMNAIEAKAKGLGSQKIVADILFAVAPIAEETNIAAGVHGEIKLNDNASIGVGAEIGTKGLKVYAEAPYEAASAELTVNYEGQVDCNYSVINGDQPKESDGTVSKTVNIGPAYITVETNQKAIAEKYKENAGELNRIKQSYYNTELDEKNFQ